MDHDNPAAQLEIATETNVESPTLIEGLPGLGMVASIAVDQITAQLGLQHTGSIRSEKFPAVAAFNDGRVRDAVRVYAGQEPSVMTLQSDIPIPDSGVEPLSQCVHENLAPQFEKAIFLVGAPAESEDQIGGVNAVATTDGVERDLTEAGIPLAQESGAIGGVTGRLLADCNRNDVPAATLVVRCDPRLPDPRAARDVINDALEPLVDFDIDTDELDERAETIQQEKQQVAQQLQQLHAGDEESPLQSQTMYQ